MRRKEKEKLLWDVKMLGVLYDQPYFRDSQTTLQFLKLRWLDEGGFAGLIGCRGLGATGICVFCSGDDVMPPRWK